MNIQEPTYSDYKCKHTIKKDKDSGLYLIFNHLGEQVDSYESFDYAYDFVVKKAKDCK